MTDEPLIRAIADELPVGIWAARAPGGELLYTNAMFAEIMGTCGRTDLAAGDWAQPYGICTKDGQPYPEEQLPFVRALQSKSTVVVDDLVIHRRDGRRVNVRAQARPVFGDDGDISHVVIAFIDITPLVEAERARQEAEKRLHRAQRMESIGNVAGGIAHDFKNLLATVKMTVSTLRLREDTAENREALELIEAVAHSGVELTQALLGFARRGRHAPVRVSLNEAVVNVFQIASRAIERRIEVGLDLATGQDGVLGDLSQLEQVVMNLVMNARDAISGTGRITLRTWREGEQVVLEVQDTGSGIPADIRDRIFEPYFTTKTHGALRGTGLGLATVHGIVEVHGGQVEVEDNLAGGTLFRVRLPAAPALTVSTAAAALAVHRAQETTAPQETEPAYAQLGGRQVLLAEASEPVRAAVQRGLEELGYEVLTAEDGEAAVAHFRRHHTTLRAVILDSRLPSLDTADACRALRTVDPGVPIFVSAGQASEAELRELMALGAKALLLEPYDLATVSRALAGV